MADQTRSVVITGASVGIGQACALRLHALGWRVFAGVRRAEDGERLAQETSPRLTPVLLDVTDSEAIAAAAAQVDAALQGGGLHGLVNNAGIAVAGPLEYLPLDELRRQFEVNVIAQVAVTQAFLPALRRATGRIVNMSSISGLVTTPLMGPYSASKFALEALTDAMRRELAPWGLHAAAVEPGAIATPIWERTLAASDRLLKRMPPEMDARYGRGVAAMQKGARRSAAEGAPPEAVARAVEHALSARRPRTRYLVGRDARLASLLAWLPDTWLDRLVGARRR